MTTPAIKIAPYVYLPDIRVYSALLEGAIARKTFFIKKVLASGKELGSLIAVQKIADNFEKHMTV